MFKELVGNLVGGVIDNKMAENAANKVNKKNYNIQKEFAQNSIRWKVEDAARAGVSRLAALGSQGYMPGVSMIGADTGNTFQNMGQDINRAIDATRTRDERASARASDMEARSIQLENGRLQNELLRSQITETNSRASNPAFPTTGAPRTIIAGQGDSHPTTNPVPVDVSRTDSGSRAKAAGTHPDLTYVDTASGGLAIVPSKDAKSLIEDQMVPELMWAQRNHLQTFLRNPPYPSQAKLPEGYSYWKWNPFMQEWRPQKGKGLPPHLLRWYKTGKVSP